MTTTPKAQDTSISEAADRKPPPPRQPGETSQPPPSALRTYMLLRLAMIGVLIALAISVALEVSNADGCVQPSISAYYYTPTRAVFVGALVTLGTCMIVLWGRNKWEDAFLNIAGLLAPVVAFVPTADANYCSVVTSTGANLTDRGADDAEAAQKQIDNLITATHQAIDNNVQTLGVVVASSLIALLVLALKDSGLLPRVSSDKKWIAEPSFYVPWGLSLSVWVVAAFAYNMNRDWFYDNAHGWSAIVMFVFIILVVLTNARIQATASRQSLTTPGGGAMGKEYRRWALAYTIVAVMMIVAAIVIPLVRWVSAGAWFADHWVLVLEATLIVLFAVFWVLQTIERRDEGAPEDPRRRQGEQS